MFKSAASHAAHEDAKKANDAAEAARVEAARRRGVAYKPNKSRKTQQQPTKATAERVRAFRHAGRFDLQMAESQARVARERAAAEAAGRAKLLEMQAKKQGR